MSLQLIYALYEKDLQCCHEEGLIEGQAKKITLQRDFSNSLSIWIGILSIYCVSFKVSMIFVEHIIIKTSIPLQDETVHFKLHNIGV